MSRNHAGLSISSGQPVVRDTCMLVKLILGMLAHGETTESILREFPSISEEDVRAVIAFAKHTAQDEQIPTPALLSSVHA